MIIEKISFIIVFLLFYVSKLKPIYFLPDLLYRQTLNVNNSALEVEIVDVCSCDVKTFPEEAIYWADACVVVYDITCRESFNQATDMLQRVLQLRNQMPTVLLGNKADLEHLRQVGYLFF